MAKILVVEDEESIARLMQVDLELSGHEVALAPDGRSALAQFPKFKPELMILDWMMPEMSGIEVLEQIKAKGWRTQVRVIMVTARVQERDILKGWQAGVDAYMSKPFDVDALSTAVTEVLEAPADMLARRREEELRKAGLLYAIDELLDE